MKRPLLYSEGRADYGLKGGLCGPGGKGVWWGEGWNGFPDALTPEDTLFDEANLKVNWDGCEKAVGTFEM